MTGPHGLLKVREFVLPYAQFAPALDALRRAGTAGDEAFVLLGGKLDQDGQILRFTSCYWPEQTPQKTRAGLLVHVGGGALHRANIAFYRRGEIMAGQVHTHPTEAFHSSTDDHYPLVTLLGALSIVIPDFAMHGMPSIHRWAYYRLAGPGVWNVVSQEIVRME